MNGGWQARSEFSDNGIEVSGADANIDTEIDREWDGTWYARIGFAHDISDQSAFTLGVSNDSPPVNDRHRTFDLPVQKYYRLWTAYACKGKNTLNYALGATLISIGPVRVSAPRVNSTTIIFYLPLVRCLMRSNIQQRTAFF
jgi:hypothetical protein